jgi:hypothetical protein
MSTTHTRFSSRLRFAVFALLAIAACAPLARAQVTTGFTGDLLLTGDSTYINRWGDGGGEFGAWTFDARTFSGDGYEEGALWTDSLPDAITIQAHTATTDTGTSTFLFAAQLSTNINTAGTLTFTVDVVQQGNATGGFYYTVWPESGDEIDSASYTAGTHTFNIALQPNEGFAFNVFANDLTSGTGDYDFTSATISGLSFTPASAIPEPSTYAALAGVCALGLATWRQRRRR